MYSLFTVVALVVLVHAQILGILALDYSVLDDDLGHTPCDMVDIIQHPCETNSSQVRKRGLFGRDEADSHIPAATSCNCNNVFFNVWSACLMSKGNTSWVCSSTTWLAACQNRSFQVETLQYSSSSSLPPWTYLPMPNNASFDILTAVSVADPDSQSGISKLQIIIPVVVGLAVILLFCLCLWLYHRRSSMRRRTWQSAVAPRRLSLWPGKRKVTHVTSRAKSWEIDDLEDIQLVSQSHTPSLPSTPSAKELTLTVEVAVPGKSMFKSVQQAVLFLAFWKRKPVRVRSRPPDRRFDIDATPQPKTKARLKKSSPLLKSYPLLSSSHLAGDPLFEHHEMDSDNEPGRLSDDDDAIPPDPQRMRSVLFISNRSANFTVSGETASERIEVVPPSPDGEPHFDHDLLQGPAQTPPRDNRRRRRSRSPRTPPAPTNPPPLPPISPPRPNLSLSSPDRNALHLSHSDPTSHTRQLSNESTSSLASRSSRRLPRPPDLAQSQSRHSRNESSQSLTPSHPTPSRRRPLPLPNLPNIRLPAPPYKAEPAEEESVLASSPIAAPVSLSSDEYLTHSRTGSDEPLVSGSTLLFADAAQPPLSTPMHGSSDSLDLFPTLHQ